MINKNNPGEIKKHLKPESRKATDRQDLTNNYVYTSTAGT